MSGANRLVLSETEKEGGTQADLAADLMNANEEATEVLGMPYKDQDDENKKEKAEEGK
jgi:hypothetical protein